MEPIEKSTLLIAFKRWITVEHAESFVSELNSCNVAPLHLTMDFTECKSMDAGVGWRIGNALARFRDTSSVLTVVVPDLSDPPRFTGKFWFNVFLRSGLGTVLARYSTIVVANDKDITEQFKLYYGKLIADNSVQASSNSVATVDLFGAHIRSENPESFYKSHLRPYWSHVKVDLETLDTDDIFSLNDLCWEAVKNVADHSDRHPSGELVRVSSDFSLRHYARLTGKSYTVGDFRGYLDRLDVSPKSISAKSHFLEVVVRDDGVGIAARQSQLQDIYEVEVSKEITYLEQALGVGATIKRTIRDAPQVGPPGYGYEVIQESLGRLSAYAVLRTGRSAAILDGSLLSPARFTPVSHALGYLPGTVLEILVPLPERQISLPGLDV